MKNNQHDGGQMFLTKTIDLRNVIAKIINDDTSENFPKVITFSRGIEFPKYKITIEEIEEDFFVDSKGVKWAKVKDTEKKESKIL